MLSAFTFWGKDGIILDRNIAKEIDTMRKRSEMDPKFTWDFTHIYKDDAAWEQAYAEGDKAIEAIAPQAGTLGQSADSLLTGFQAVDAASRILETV